MSPLLEARNLLVRREGRPVLDVEHLAVTAGQVLAIIGPNGAGKSTLLLALGLLLQPDRGQVWFRGRPADAEGELAYRRRIGLVLQEPLLLDASVRDNVTIGLRFRGLPRSEVNARADEWLARLGIAHLQHRPARALSGGEAQRTSLARALALQPELLLLDEPFSALDTPTRARLLDDLRSLLAATRVTTVFVTHDRDEALLLGDQVAVLLDGRLRQVGPPEQVFTAPADGEVAAFVGVETVIPGRVVAAHEGQVLVAVRPARPGQGDLHLEAVVAADHTDASAPPGPAGDWVGRPVLACLRPEDVTLWAGDVAPHSSARNRLPGRVARLTPQGPLVRVVVDCAFPVVALITRASAREMGLTEGQPVTATFKASAVHLLSRSDPAGTDSCPPLGQSSE